MTYSDNQIAFTQQQADEREQVKATIIKHYNNFISPIMKDLDLDPALWTCHLVLENDEDAETYAQHTQLCYALTLKHHDAGQEVATLKIITRPTQPIQSADGDYEYKKAQCDIYLRQTGDQIYTKIAMPTNSDFTKQEIEKIILNEIEGIENLSQSITLEQQDERQAIENKLRLYNREHLEPLLNTLMKRYKWEHEGKWLLKDSRRYTEHPLRAHQRIVLKRKIFLPLPGEVDPLKVSVELRPSDKPNESVSLYVKASYKNVTYFQSETYQTGKIDPFLVKTIAQCVDDPKSAKETFARTQQAILNTENPKAPRL